jgi:hypothetical protein
MKSIIFLIIILLVVNTVFPQTWSDPVTISKTGFNYSPDFKIDKAGVIHCIWAQEFEYNFKKIYYSKSMNNGETWTNPIPVTSNSNLWLDDPHIVADTSGNLYVSYDYNVGGWPNSNICYVKFNASDSTWSQQTEIAIGMSNRLVIDHNNRVYFFWFAGTEYYRYLDDSILSDTFSVSEGTQLAYWFDNLSVDNQNKVHCVGNRTAGNHSHGAYFDFYSGVWSPYLDLSNESFFECGVSLNSIGFPSFVWRQVMPDSNQDVRGTYYSEFDGDSVQNPVFFSDKSTFPAIVIDCYDHPHVVEVEKMDSGYQLVHRFISGDTWQKEIIEQNKNGYGRNILISKNSCIYLFYNKADTVYISPPGSYYGMIIFRKLELPPGFIENSQKPEMVAYPNPFSDQTSIEFLLSETEVVTLSIYDPKGNFITCLLDKKMNAGKHQVIWNRFEIGGEACKPGIYIAILKTPVNGYRTIKLVAY